MNRLPEDHSPNRLIFFTLCCCLTTSLLLILETRGVAFNISFSLRTRLSTIELTQVCLQRSQNIFTETVLAHTYMKFPAMTYSPIGVFSWQPDELDTFGDLQLVQWRQDIKHRDLRSCDELWGVHPAETWQVDCQFVDGIVSWQEIAGDSDPFFCWLRPIIAICIAWLAPDSFATSTWHSKFWPPPLTVVIEVHFEIVESQEMRIARQIGYICRIYLVLVHNPIEEMQTHGVDVDHERDFVVVDGPRDCRYRFADQQKIEGYRSAAANFLRCVLQGIPIGGEWFGIALGPVVVEFEIPVVTPTYVYTSLRTAGTKTVVG